MRQCDGAADDPLVATTVVAPIRWNVSVIAVILAGGVIGLLGAFLR